MPKVRSTGRAQKDQPRLGFLAAGHRPQLGYLGGLLITTATARPVEFHYTLPVRPGPTHRILYGPELEPHIYQSLIATTLLEQISPPAFLFTDQPLILPHRLSYHRPILLVVPAEDDLPTSGHPDPGRQAIVVEGQAAGSASASQPFQFEVRSHSQYPRDREALLGWLREQGTSLDLLEPFGRVWAALAEVLGEGSGRRQEAAA